MIRHELVTGAGGLSGVASIRWDVTAGVRYELDAEGVVIREGAAPLVVADGVEGLGHPQFEVFGQSTPRTPGRRRTGQRAKERKCFLPLMFRELGEEWASVQRLFWRCVTPNAAVMWRVISPEGFVRSLQCILDPAAGSYGLDPSVVTAAEPLDMVADDPFWKGPKQTALLAVSGDGTSFFGPNNAAPPFYIQPSSTNGSHRFMVDGDLEAWPVLELVGPIPAWSVSNAAGTQTVGGLPLLANDRLRIDFDPTRQVAIRTRGGVQTNVTDQLTQSGFFRLVADSMGGMDVNTYVSGTGSLALTYEARYWRAV